MKTLRNTQVGFILTAELSHLIFIEKLSSTEMNDIFEEPLRENLNSILKHVE